MRELQSTSTSKHPTAPGGTRSRAGLLRHVRCIVMATCYGNVLWQRVMAAGARQGCLGAFVLQSDVGFVQENLRVIEQVSPRPTCLVVFAYFTHLSTT